jgi:hypothetical protein
MGKFRKPSNYDCFYGFALELSMRARFYTNVHRLFVRFPKEHFSVTE